MLSKCIVLFAALSTPLALAQTAMAQDALARSDLLERYETASERLSGNFIGFYLSRLPEHADKMPGTDWEEVDREIGTCVLAQIEDEKGRDAAESLVVVVETMADTEIASFADFQRVITFQISDGAALAALSGCGQQDRAFLRDYEAGLVDLLSDPAIVARLQAD
jgi:hypothetical protein